MSTGLLATNDFKLRNPVYRIPDAIALKIPAALTQPCLSQKAPKRSLYCWLSQLTLKRRREEIVA